jgi:hypothetical protein
MIQQRQSRTNLLVGIPGEYIYFQRRNNKFAAFKRYLEEPENPLNKKHFNKCALFDSFDEAREYLRDMPPTMPRPYRYDTLLQRE